MRQILQKLAWKTNNWSAKFGLLNLYFGGDNNKFGFQLCNIDNGVWWKGSLLEITWSFPTVTHGGELNIDILYLYRNWSVRCIDMGDRELWGAKLSVWERLNVYVHDKFSNIR